MPPKRFAFDGPGLLEDEYDLELPFSPEHQRLFLNADEMENLPLAEKTMLIRHRMAVKHRPEISVADRKQKRENNAIITLVRAGYHIYSSNGELLWHPGNLGEMDGAVVDNNRAPLGRRKPKRKKKSPSPAQNPQAPGLGLEPMQDEPERESPILVPVPAPLPPLPPLAPEPPLQARAQTGEVKQLMDAFKSAYTAGDMDAAAGFAAAVAAKLSHADLVDQLGAVRTKLLRDAISAELQRRERGQSSSQTPAAQAIAKRKATPKKAKGKTKAQKAREAKQAEVVYNLHFPPERKSVSPPIDPAVLARLAATQQPLPEPKQRRPSLPARTDPAQDVANAAAMGMNLVDYHKAIYGSGFGGGGSVYTVLGYT